MDTTKTMSCLTVWIPAVPHHLLSPPLSTS